MIIMGSFNKVVGGGDDSFFCIYKRPKISSIGPLEVYVRPISFGPNWVEPKP